MFYGETKQGSTLGSRAGFVILNRIIRAVLAKKVTLNKNSKEVRKRVYGNWGKIIPDRRKGKCKGPVVQRPQDSQR